MANEAFALSPISARATRPSDEDYDAISEAFMETARGRWFLGEYAKRNRNADTRMVLDAVARIEQSLAAQKQPASDTRLAEALAGLRTAVDEAKAATSAACDGFALEEHLAPVRKGIRVIREISWRWREIGADGRICDLIDQQINAIETSCSHIASADPRTALNAAFDLIGERLAGFCGDDDAPPEAAAAAAPSAAASPNEMPAVAAAQAEAVDGEADATLSAQASGPDDTATVARTPDPIDEPADTTAEAASESATEVAEAATEAVAVATVVAEATTEVTETPAGVAETAMETLHVATDATNMTTAAADAHDDAVLDMIAAEMAAPDASDADFAADSGDMDFADPPRYGDEAAAVTREPPVRAMAQPSIPHMAEACVETLREPSLGSTLIANGILRKPVAAANDPLASIRRLSQAEKIALFS